jgi:hypothetical protein
MTRMETLSQAVERRVKEGYTDDFRVEGDGLRALADGRWLRPEDLVCDAIERFEGASDPDDQTLLLVLRTPDGAVRGTLATSFGPGLDPALAEVVRRLPEPRRAGSGA